MLGVAAGMFGVDAAANNPLYAGIVKLRIGPGSAKYLVDQSGKVIYHSDSAQIDSNHIVSFHQLWQHVPPHQPRFEEAMHQDEGAIFVGASLHVMHANAVHMGIGVRDIGNVRSKRGIAHNRSPFSALRLLWSSGKRERTPTQYRLLALNRLPKLRLPVS
jgi:hypothetical protein